MSTPMALVVNSFTSVTHRAFYTDKSQIFMRSAFIGIIGFINTQGAVAATCRSIQKAALENHVGQFTQSLPEARIKSTGLSLMHFVCWSSAPGAVMGLLCQGQDEIRVHMGFFSSSNAHQAVPFALFTAAHILLLAH